MQLLQHANLLTRQNKKKRPLMKRSQQCSHGAPMVCACVCIDFAAAYSFIHTRLSVSVEATPPTSRLRGQGLIIGTTTNPKLARNAILAPTTPSRRPPQLYPTAHLVFELLHPRLGQTGHVDGLHRVQPISVSLRNHRAEKNEEFNVTARKCGRRREKAGGHSSIYGIKSKWDSTTLRENIISKSIYHSEKSGRLAEVCCS